MNMGNIFIYSFDFFKQCSVFLIKWVLYILCHIYIKYFILEGTNVTDTLDLISNSTYSLMYIEQWLTFVGLSNPLYPCYKHLVVLGVLVSHIIRENKMSYFFLPNLPNFYFLFFSVLLGWARVFSMVL